MNLPNRWWTLAVLIRIFLALAFVAVGLGAAFRSIIDPAELRLYDPTPAEIVVGT